MQKTKILKSTSTFGENLLILSILIFFQLQSFSQTAFEVKGIISNESNEVPEGATIVIKGSSIQDTNKILIPSILT